MSTIYEKLDNLARYARANFHGEIAEQLSMIIDRAVWEEADIYQLCPSIDSYIHEVENNLKQDEYEWRRYSGDGNQPAMVMMDVMNDFAETDYLAKKGFSTSQIQEIVNLAVTRYHDSYYSFENHIGLTS